MRPRLRHTDMMMSYYVSSFYHCLLVSVQRRLCFSIPSHERPQWDTTDAEIKVPSVENGDLTNVLCLKPEVGQNIATYASPTARIGVSSLS